MPGCRGPARPRCSAGSAPRPVSGSADTSCRSTPPAPGRCSPAALSATPVLLGAGRIDSQQADARQPDSWHHLGLRFVGTTITAEIDGRAVMTVSDDEHRTGQIALQAGQWSPVQFDDIAVTPTAEPPVFASQTAPARAVASSQRRVRCGATRSTPVRRSAAWPAHDGPRARASPDRPGCRSTWAGRAASLESSTSRGIPARPWS